jgi:hypothetical protein
MEIEVINAENASLSLPEWKTFLQIGACAGPTPLGLRSPWSSL